MNGDSHLISPFTPERNLEVFVSWHSKNFDKLALYVTQGLSRHLFKDVFVPPTHTKKIVWATCDRHPADLVGRRAGGLEDWGAGAIALGISG